MKKKTTFRECRVCHLLGTQGPCPDEYTFVLSDDPGSDGMPLGVCRRTACDPSIDLSVTMAESGKCVAQGSTEECPPGMEVLMDPFGKGEQEGIRVPRSTNDKLGLHSLQHMLFTTLPYLLTFPSHRPRSQLRIEVENSSTQQPPLLNDPLLTPSLFITVTLLPQR